MNPLIELKRAAPLFLIVLLLAWFALPHSAQAVSPPPDGGYPGGNTAEGTQALLSQTTGLYNAALSFVSLRNLTTASLNTGVGAGTLVQNNGDENTATPRSRPTPTPRPPPSRFVEPNFLLPANPDVNDYRPVVSAEGTTVIFERNHTATPDDVKLYSLDLSTGNVQPFVTFASTRADWCWNRSGGQLTSGPVAFSNALGIYRVDTGGQSVLLPNTAGMIYPSWYPDCEHLAVDVTGAQVTAEIDAHTGTIIISPLANETVWAGFASVNQTNPNLVAFAGQFNGESNYYSQDLNYVWVTDRTTVPPMVAPLDRQAPNGPAFLQKFQARAGWWSPDGRWFAFESNRICNEIDGQTYAIFIQDAQGARPAMQVTACTWDIQHPKWFPPREDGKTLLIVAVQAGPGEPFRIASLDVSRFVEGTSALKTPNERE